MQVKKQLPRLAPVNYQGSAYVFWTHAIEKRETGWLDAEFHVRFREGLLHCLCRYQLSCPTYVLMPDHIHLVWIGASPASDQLRASTYFRKYLNARLLPIRLQCQAHDHVLRESERERQCFSDTVAYLRHNPERAGLVERASDWAYSGAIVPGYPELGWGSELYWETFWKCHHGYIEWLRR